MPTAPYPLGRVRLHDPRSLAYGVGELPRRAVKSVDWTRRVPVFDQGSLGSCTGNAAAGLLGTDSAARPGLTSVTVDATGLRLVDEDFAVGIYSLATQLDAFAGTYPPDDTGSSGLGAAKALKRLGLATGYRHAFSVNGLRTALQAGPVMVGIKWLESMFSTDPEGFVTVDRSSAVAGGHEFVVSAWDAPGDRYRIDNSWAEGWGLNGRAWLHGGDLAWLLSDGGDVTQPQFAAAPPPSPGPAPVVPDAQLWEVAKAWAAGRGLT